MSVILNASTSSGFVQSADTSGNLELQSNGTTKLSVLSTGVSGTIVQGTAVTTTSGTSFDFTGVPSWAKRITVMFGGVSTNGTSVPLVQLGSGSVTTSGYDAVGTGYSTAIGTTNYTAGFGICDSSAAANVFNGMLILTNISGNTWAASGLFKRTSGSGCSAAGAIALSGVLDRVRITTVGGTDTFDAGSINIQYEG